MRETSSSSAGRGALVVAVAGAAIGGWFLFDVVRLRSENHPWAIGSLFGLVVGAAVGFYKWQEWRADRARRAEQARLEEKAARRAAEGKKVKRTHVDWRDPRFRPDRSWIAPVAVLLVFGFLGLQAGFSGRSNYLRTYCLYGSQSSAQLNGCMSHVTTDDVNRLDTQAARFARGETSDCLEDSGPFCAGASQWNTIEPDQGVR